MTYPTFLRIYGDLSYRGPCPKENVEQVSIINKIRLEYPTSYGRLVVHVRNEGKRTHQQTIRHKAEGLTPGAPDVIIPVSIPFLCEVKRRNPTLSKVSYDQLDYLEAAYNEGAFVCLAFGAVAAWEAMQDWIKEIDSGRN